jgi:ABC-type oligopeptide transport system substrate-binding subunit
MSRRIRFLLVLCAFSFALASAACADSTGPRQAKQSTACDVINPNTCTH